MAVGFTPKYSEEYLLTTIKKEKFLVLAIESAKRMEWEISYINDNGFIAYRHNSYFSSNAEIKVKIEEGLATLSSASIGSEMIDWGRNKKNIEKFIDILEDFKSTLTDEMIQEKYLEIKASMNQEEDILNQPVPTTTEKISGFFSFFKPTQGFFVTPILIDLNILVFILMAFSGVNILLPDTESLIAWGANFKPLTLGGEWWRLITNCFLHIGIIHLLMNMYALVYIGLLLEPHLGRARFITAYLLTCITASITSLWWHDITISAGASGAVFGMYGVFLALLTTNFIEKTARKTLLTSIGIFVGYNLLYGMKGGIDNAAHIGGLIGGLVIGYAMIPSLKKPQENKLKFATIALLSIIILTSSFVVYKKIPNDIGKYNAEMEKFAELEKKALEVYNLPETESPEKIITELKIHGIDYWKQSIQLIDNIEKLNLPDELLKRNRLLKEYCELRIKSYELLVRAISENTTQYQEQTMQYNKLIEEKIKELGASPN